MSKNADNHTRLVRLWNEIGRGPVIKAPEYERAEPSYFCSRVRRYAFKDYDGGA